MARRRYQEGSVFLRGNVWTGRYLDDVITETGEIKRVHRSKVLGHIKTIQTKSLALRELQKELAKVNSVNYMPTRQSNFRTFAIRWLETVATQFKPSTQSSTKSVVNHLLIPYFGELQMSSMTTEMLQMFVSQCGSACGLIARPEENWTRRLTGTLGKRAARCDTEKEPGGESGHALSPKTIRNAVMTLRSMWKTARAWGYIQHNPFEGLRLPRVPRPQVRVFTTEEVRKILAAAPEPYNTFYTLLAETGLRAGEAAGLRWEDVDILGGVLQVRQSVWDGKTQAPKSVAGIRPINISLKLAAKLRNLGCKDNGNSSDVSLVFHASNGSPWRPDLIVKRKLHPLLKALGIEKAGLHAFRHFNASLMDTQGVPVKVRQTRLGHSDASLTLNRYTHVQESDRLVPEAIYATIQQPTGVVQ